MQIFELRQKAFDDITNHKIMVERVAEGNLLHALQVTEIKKLYDDIKDNKRQLATLQNNPKLSEKLEKCIVRDRDKIKKLFASNNLDITAVVPKYWCHKCKDTGLYGKGMCECVNARVSKYLMNTEAQCGEADFAKADFSIFADPKYTKMVYSKAQAFVDKMDTTKYNNFSILGGVGVGKTYLMECMANRAMNLGKYVIYMSAFRLNQAFLKYYTAPMSDKNSILQPLLDCDLLCIDDLGCEQLLNNVTVPMLIMLVNERNTAGKKTIITSNLSLDEIRERYDYRLCSRLVDHSVSIAIELSGSDLRQNSKKKCE